MGIISLRVKFMSLENTNFEVREVTERFREHSATQRARVVLPTPMSGC